MSTLDTVSARVALEPSSQYVLLYGNFDNTLTIAGTTLRRPDTAEDNEFIYETSGYIKVRIIDQYNILGAYVLAGEGDNTAELLDMGLNNRCVKFKDLKKLGLQAQLDQLNELDKKLDFNILANDSVALNIKAAESAVKTLIGIAKTLNDRYNSFPNQIQYAGTTLVRRATTNFDYNYVEYFFETAKIKFNVGFGIFSKSDVEVQCEIQGLTNKGKSSNIDKSTSIKFKSVDACIAAAVKLLDENQEFKSVLSTNTSNADKHAVFKYDLLTGLTSQYGDRTDKTTMINDREAFLKDLNNLLRRYAIKVKK